MVTLIRHAESLANAGLATHDPATIPLTPAGHLQAEQLARFAFHSPVEAIWCSPYLRAVQTASPTAERYGLALQEHPIHEFTYLCPARCMDTTPVERMQWVADYWSRSDPFHIDGPGAESFATFVARVRNALRLLEAEGSTRHAVAFSHGQFLQMIYWLNMYRGDPVSREGMQAYRALDVQLPIRHCHGLRISMRSGASDIGVERWSPA